MGSISQTLHDKLMSLTETMSLQQGVSGMEVIDDTSLHQGNYVRIIVIADSVFSTLTGNTTVTLPKKFLAGNTIDGSWTEIQLTSGEIQVYKGV